MVNLNELEVFFADLAIEHQGQSLTEDNLTIEGLAYLLDMGLKQALGDVASVNRPNIIGTTADGGLPKGNWKDAKRAVEAKRLGFVAFNPTNADDRARLADLWIADAIETKFVKIMSGELTVSENGTRGDEVLREMRSLVEKAITTRYKKDNLSLPKPQQKVIPTGKEMRKLVDDRLADEAIAKQIRTLAETRIAESQFTID